MREIMLLASVAHGVQFGKRLEQARVVGRLMEDRVSNSPPLNIPEWVPPAVVEAAKDLNDKLPKEKDPVMAQEVLSRLVSHQLMERVWREIFRKKRVRHKPTEEYLNPALTCGSSVAAYRQKASDLRKKGGEENEHNAKLLEAEAAIIDEEFDPLVHPRWSTQDRAAQLLLWHAYRTALDNKPVYLSDIEAKTRDLRKLVKELITGVKTLQSHSLDHEARRLNKLAEEIEDEAHNTDPFLDPQTGHRLAQPRFPHIDDPWAIVRKTPDVQMRSFVVCLSIATIQLFGKPLYHTLANITNAVFDRRDVTDGRVRELLRIRSE
jgi:hypothetical protein